MIDWSRKQQQTPTIQRQKGTEWWEKKKDQDIDRNKRTQGYIWAGVWGGGDQLFSCFSKMIKSYIHTPLKYIHKSRL